MRRWRKEDKLFSVLFSGFACYAVIILIEDLITHRAGPFVWCYAGAMVLSLVFFVLSARRHAREDTQFKEEYDKLLDWWYQGRG